MVEFPPKTGKGFEFRLGNIAGTCTSLYSACFPLTCLYHLLVRWTSEVAAYTDVYFQYIPKNGDLTTAEKLEGWMVSHLADKSVVKKKARTVLLCF